MKQTSRISRSRSFHGSRPRTRSSPRYGIRPRIAFSAVVLPAPFGPIIPRMRPSSTRRPMPASATVVPNVLRRPRASMHGMDSALLLFSFRLRLTALAAIQQFFRREAEPLNSHLNPGPFFSEKFLALAFHKQIARAIFDEHPQPPPLLDQSFIHQFLVALQDRERIQPVVCRDCAHRWQGIAFFEHAVENHRYDAVPQLAVNRLIVVPLTVHSCFPNN